MRLSVIVPVYNMAAGDKLKWCLDSLVGQTLPAGSYEIIAVDDCSTDESPAILDRYAAAFPDRFTALHSPENHHQGGAKNIGLSRARGEWIGFIDADDWVTPDYYEKLLAKADATGADMVGCDYCLTYEHSWKTGRIVHNNTPEQTGVMDTAKYRKLLMDTGSLVVKIYRRGIIYGKQDDGAFHRFFPEDIFYEDNAVSNTWMLRVKHFEYLQEPLYYYYQHDASTVHTITRKNLEDRRVSGRMILSEAEEQGYFEQYRPELEFMFTALFYVNTLFSAMPRKNRFPGCYAFTASLADEMKAAFPDFQKNRYYQERIHPEEKKLIAMQMRSQLLFYVYYRALWCYRDLRKKIKHA
jgi:glycosyltransferase involved in cell wall biosynthesis